MWKLNCGCNPPTEDKEIIINKKPKSSFNNIKLPNTQDKTSELKCEIIQDFLDIIDKLECGIQPDLQEILEELSIIDLNMESFNISKKVYSFNSKDDEDVLLRKSKYFSEFETEEDRQKAVKNLGLDSVKHIVLSKDEYENIDYFDKNAIYFITG